MFLLRQVSRVFVIAAMLGSAVFSSALVSSARTSVAPADEYFGRLKMSILGIRNELHDLDQKITFAPDRAADVLGTCGYVEDAIRDWQAKYPADPWLPKSVYQLEHVYSRVPTDEGRRDTSRALHWLTGRYPHSAFAARAVAELGTSYNQR